MLDRRSDVEAIGDLFHKEKKQKKYNKTKGQFDNLKEYTNSHEFATRKSDNLASADKQIRREANYQKNIHIDTLYEKFKSYELIMDDQYKAWWCGTMHTLGVAFVEAQAHHALAHGKSPAALFHFLINKAMNSKTSPGLPRF